MSLINKMLQDLDARGGDGARADASSVVRPVGHAAQSGMSPTAIGAGVLALAVLGGAAFAAYKYFRGGPLPASAPAAQQAGAVIRPAHPVEQDAATRRAAALAAGNAPAAPGQSPQAVAPDVRASNEQPHAPAARASSAQAHAPAAHVSNSKVRAPEAAQPASATSIRQRRVADTSGVAAAKEAPPARRELERVAAQRAQEMTAKVGASAHAGVGRAGAGKAAGHDADSAAPVASSKRAAEQRSRKPVDRVVAAKTGAAATVGGAGGAVNGKAAGEGVESPLNSQQKAENEYRRALASLQDARVSDAIAGLEQAVYLYPRHEAARQTLVSLLVEGNRPAEAIRHLTFATSLDPRQANMAMLLARLQLEHGGNALDTLQRSLPYAESNPEYRALLAGVLQRQNRHKEAADHYQAAVRLQPGNAVWWMGMGISLQADKRNAEAKVAFQRARDAGRLAPELQSFVERRLQQLN